MLENLLTTPLISLVLLTVLVAEGLFLFFLWKRSIIGIPPGQTFAFLGAGVAFSLALACVLSEAPPLCLALSLIVAFVLHIMDLRFRWQAGPHAKMTLGPDPG